MHSKLTLYDFLCIFIFGWLILFPFIGCIGDEPKMQVAIFIFSYIVGLLSHKCIECGSKKIKTLEKWLSDLESKARDEAFTKFKKKTKETITDRKFTYVEAYYYLIKNNSLNVIPVLEAQVAFLRNLLLILPYYFFIVLYKRLEIFDFCYCTVLLFIIIIFAIAFLIWQLIQRKVFYLVWEGCFYIQLLEKKGK